jgi:hypothetical protein
MLLPPKLGMQVKSLEEQFRKQNQRLEAQLEEALAERDMVHMSAIDTDTPADKTLKLLDKIMRGHEVRSGLISQGWMYPGNVEGFQSSVERKEFE